MYVVTPSKNDDNKNCGIIYGDTTGTPLTDLKDIVVYGHRFSDPDTVVLGTLNHSTPGDTIPFDLTIVDGSMGIIFTKAEDLSGNKSCIGAQYEFAVPAKDIQYGLSGDYFNNLDFTAYTFTRIDSTINFDWGAGSPDPSISPNTYSILWRGFITVPVTDLYTFYTDVNDAARLHVDNISVIDSWCSCGRRELVGQITLSAGIHPITLEYYQDTVNAAMIFKYSSASISKQVIPASILSH